MENNSKAIYGRVLNRDAGTIKRMEETRTIPFVASTATKDRHGSILNMEGWGLENFKANPVIGYQHQLHPEMCVKATPDDVIGKAMNIRVADNMLLMDIWFETEDMNPLAEKVFKKLLKGTLNAVSVGFLPVLDEKGRESRMGDAKKGEDPTAEYMHGQELLEVSVVNIPSNPDALQKAVRSSTANALLFVKRQLNKSFAEIEEMTVRQVVDLLEGKEIKENVEQSTEVEESQEEVIEKATDIDVVSEVEMMKLELELKRIKTKQNERI